MVKYVYVESICNLDVILWALNQNISVTCLLHENEQKKPSIIPICDSLIPPLFSLFYFLVKYLQNKL